MIAQAVSALPPQGHPVYSRLRLVAGRPRKPLRMQSDSILIQAGQLDPAALAEIHDRYYAEVFRYVAYRVRQPQAREDISAEVFLRLLGALQRGRGPRRNLRGWLLGTAAHLVVDHYRHDSRHATEILDEAHPDRGESPAVAAERSLEESRVRQAMQRLTRDQQHVLALRFSEERSLEETAQIMERSVAAVKVLQFRALAALRRALGDEEARHAA